MAVVKYKLLHLSHLQCLHESDGYQTLILLLRPSVREVFMLDPVFMLFLILFRKHPFLSSQPLMTGSRRISSRFLVQLRTLVSISLPLLTLKSSMDTHSLTRKLIPSNNSFNKTTPRPRYSTVRLHYHNLRFSLTLCPAALFGAKLANLEVPSHDSVPARDLGDLDNFNFFNAISTIAPNYSGEAVSTSAAIDNILQPPVDLIDLVPSNPFSWTDLLNPEQPWILSDINQFSLPSSCDDFSQLLPEIDLSALQLPSSLYAPPQPQPNSLPDGARLAKLEQLQLLREQTRLLEQDLAVSV